MFIRAARNLIIFIAANRTDEEKSQLLFWFHTGGYYGPPQRVVISLYLFIQVRKSYYVVECE